jgi:hypothetical protein
MLYKPKKIDYTSPASAQGGPGVQKQITHYFGSPYIDMTAATFAGVSAAIGASLGDIWWLGGDARANGGNAFMFVKATAGLTLGQLVAASATTTGTATFPGAGTAASPLTTAASITTNINNAATVAVNGDVDNWIWVTATGAALPQLRRIKYNSSSTTSFYKVALPDPLRPNSPTDQDVFDTLATNGDAVSIIRPYNVLVCTATLTPIGVALGTVTSGNYTIVQVAGLACVTSVGNGNALVVNQPAIPTAGGAIKGSAAAAANLYTGASCVLPQLASSAASLIIPAYVNFTGQ